MLYYDNIYLWESKGLDSIIRSSYYLPILQKKSSIIITLSIK